MKKILGILFLIIVLGSISSYFLYVKPSLKVATGYVAKYACSSAFVAGFDDEKIASNFPFSPINQAEFTIDRDKKFVEVTLAGFTRRAYYYEAGRNCGCMLDSVSSVVKKANVKHKKTLSFRDSLPWPLGDKISDTIPHNVDVEKLNNFLTKELNEKPAILAVTVAYNNQLVTEKYGKGVTKDSRLLGWSMTKSIASSMFGVADREGLIDISKSAGFPEWQNDKRKEITINNLLQMSSGLKWEEDYLALSTITRMLYLEPNCVSYSAEAEAVHNPDEVWYYSSGTSNLLSGVLRNRLESDQAYWEFPYKKLFDQIGMTSAIIEMDPAGNYILSSYAWASARDWTRFGLLYLNKGNWFGKRIFTKEWAKYSTEIAPASNGEYGAQLWLNHNQELPSVPKTAFFERGFGGQRIMIIPSKNMVITMLSGYQEDYNFDHLAKNILACFDIK